MGGGIGMGNTCKPMAVSFQCMTKSTTKKKKKNQIHKYMIYVCVRVLPQWLSGKESACSAGDVGSIPGLGRFPGGGHGYPL